MDTKKYSGRGKKEAAKLKRDYCVSVRLHADEVAILDSRRQRNQRGSYLRAVLLYKAPPVIPQVNQQLHRDLGRALGNLSTLATSMRGGSYIELQDVLAAVRDLKMLLVTGLTTQQSEAHVSPADAPEEDEAAS